MKKTTWQHQHSLPGRPGRDPLNLSLIHSWPSIKLCTSSTSISQICIGRCFKASSTRTFSMRSVWNHREEDADKYCRTLLKTFSAALLAFGAASRDFKSKQYFYILVCNAIIPHIDSLNEDAYPLQISSISSESNSN